ncbi:DUF429 domain-containing protein [Tepidamorphus sp. 3E244]|uniref:DUF429 domain-containing protein n=1 Tax=Tepidamorphus sp. 3E244 TaxID=3385498 RepID=UPI0038FBED24
MSDGPRWVAGVDGCPSGWICALLRIVDGRPVDGQLQLVEDFAAVLALEPSPEIIAIDMPIGLPDRTTTGGRPPERSVRPLLGQRQSSVFGIPSRAAVFADDYAGACRLAQETSEPSRKVSKQAFHIFPKIREIDALMTPALQARVFECHPEAAFMQANGGPVPVPKKIAGRVNPPGIAWRIALLAEVGLPKSMFAGGMSTTGRYAMDDLADAAACALTAWRILGGRAVRFPKDPVHDGHGLDMAIWA